MAWERVPKDASEHFYKAQFNIGGAYYKLGETDEAVAVWKNIPESASEQYEMAQTNLSIIAENQEKAKDSGETEQQDESAKNQEKPSEQKKQSNEQSQEG